MLVWVWAWREGREGVWGRELGRESDQLSPDWLRVGLGGSPSCLTGQQFTSLMFQVYNARISFFFEFWSF